MYNFISLIQYLILKNCSLFYYYLFIIISLFFYQFFIVIFYCHFYGDFIIILLLVLLSFLRLFLNASGRHTSYVQGSLFLLSFLRLFLLFLTASGRFTSYPKLSYLNFTLIFSLNFLTASCRPTDLVTPFRNFSRYYQKLSPDSKYSSFNSQSKISGISV